MTQPDTRPLDLDAIEARARAHDMDDGTCPWCDTVPALVDEVRQVRGRIVEFDDEIDTETGVCELLVELRASRRDALIDWRYANTLRLNLERLHDLVDEFRKREESRDRIRRRLEGEASRAREALQAVRELHPMRDDRTCYACVDEYDNPQTWPCETVRALDAALGSRLTTDVQR